MTSSLDMIRGRSNIVTLTNNSGGPLIAGDVCIQDTSADENVTTTTSANSTNKVLIAAEAIASAASGRFYESGYCPFVNVNASVTRGHYLFTHTVAKQATGSASYAAGAFGRILKSGTSPSAIIYSATAQTSGSNATQIQGVNVSATTPTTNQVLKYDSSYWVPSAAGGGGGTALKRIWSPDMPPASPTTQNDEFNDGSLDVKWSEFDPNSVLTVSESSTYNLVSLTQATRAGSNITGIYQTIPAGDFTIWARVSMLVQRRNYFLTGLALWENPADTSKSITTIGLTSNASATLFEIIHWTNHNTFNSAVLTINIDLQTHAYLRVRRASTSYFAAYSTDGISWWEFGGDIGPLATPTKFGVFTDNEAMTVDGVGVFPFFRYLASDVGTYGIMPGALIDQGTF